MTVHRNPQHTSAYECARVNSAQVIYILGVKCRVGSAAVCLRGRALMAVRQLVQHYDKVNCQRFISTLSSKLRTHDSVQAIENNYCP